MALATTLLLGLAIAYASAAILLWFAQERLLFQGARAAPAPAAPPGWRIEKVSFKATDGATLAGVLLLPPAPRPPLVIYYGGNAEESTAHAQGAAEEYGQRAVLLVNYRGYGESAGRPTEAALVSDALALHDWAAARSDLDGSRIAVHGRSLGSGVAVAVAAARPVTCVVLTTPFDSAREVAAALYPWLPVAWLMRHPFDSAALAPRIRVPALVLIADEDTIVPRHHGERLASVWGGRVEVRHFPGFGHNDLDLNPQYAPSIRAFLDACG